MRIEEHSGSGFLPGIPTAVATAPCRIKYDDGGQILEVVPPGQLFSDEVPSPETSSADAPSKGKKG
jgi:hypothetical protein